MVVWVLEPGDVVWPDGTAPSAAELGALRVRPARDACDGVNGACGRCPVPAAKPPQVLDQGASCGLPAFAKRRAGSSASDDLDALRHSVRIDVPGPCACTFDPLSTGASEPAFVAIGSRPDPWPVLIFAESPDGTLGLFDQRFATLVAPDGGRRTMSLTSTEDACTPASDPVPRFPGPVTGALGLRDGRFLVVSKPTGVITRLEASYHVLDPERGWFETDLGSLGLPSTRASSRTSMAPTPSSSRARPGRARPLRRPHSSGAARSRDRRGSSASTSSRRAPACASRPPSWSASPARRPSSAPRPRGPSRGGDQRERPDPGSQRAGVEVRPRGRIGPIRAEGQTGQPGLEMAGDPHGRR